MKKRTRRAHDGKPSERSVTQQTVVAPPHQLNIQHPQRKSALYQAAPAIIALVSLLLGGYLQWQVLWLQTRVQEQKQRIESDRVLDEAWDALGGKQYTEVLTSSNVGAAASERADRLIHQAETTDAGYSRVDLVRGARWRLEGNPSRALESYDKALSKYPSVLSDRDKRECASIQNSRGLALRALGQRDSALAAYDAALGLNDVPAIHSNRAMLLLDEEKWDEALAEYQYYVGLEKQNAVAYSNIGFILERLGRLREALEAYERALELDSSNPTIRNNRENVARALDHGARSAE